MQRHPGNAQNPEPRNLRPDAVSSWVVVKLGVLCLGVLLLVLVSGEFGNSNSLLKEASGRWALRQ
jgi:hypothetical protein